jgi:hypothetical protein
VSNEDPRDTANEGPLTSDELDVVSGGGPPTMPPLPPKNNHIIIGVPPSPGQLPNPTPNPGSGG